MRRCPPLIRTGPCGCVSDAGNSSLTSVSSAGGLWHRPPAGSGSEVLAAEESLDDVWQVVVGADQVVHALPRAGLEEDHGDDGEGDSDDRANNGEAAAVRLDGGGDDGHFGGSQCGWLTDTGPSSSRPGTS